jgi:hypothetical protein
MWIRLAAVCMLGFAGVLALRATTGRPPPPPQAIGGSDDIVLVNLASKSDKLSTVDESETKIVNVETIRLAALQANAKADTSPERETRHRSHFARRHLHHRRSHKARRH